MSTREELTRLAEKFLRQGRVDDAITHYQSAAAMAPVDWGVVKQLADVLERAGQREGAAVQFCRWADHLFAEGFHSKAAALYKKVLKLEPIHEHALWQLAEVSLALKLKADARVALQRVIDLRQRRHDTEGVAIARARLDAVEAAPGATAFGGHAALAAARAVVPDPVATMPLAALRPTPEAPHEPSPEPVSEPVATETADAPVAQYADVTIPVPKADGIAEALAALRGREQVDDGTDLATVPGNISAAVPWGDSGIDSGIDSGTNSGADSSADSAAGAPSTGRGSDHPADQVFLAESPILDRTWMNLAAPDPAGADPHNWHDVLTTEAPTATGLTADALTADALPDPENDLASSPDSGFAQPAAVVEETARESALARAIVPPVDDVHTSDHAHDALGSLDAWLGEVSPPVFRAPPPTASSDSGFDWADLLGRDVADAACMPALTTAASPVAALPSSDRDAETRAAAEPQREAEAPVLRAVTEVQPKSTEAPPVSAPMFSVSNDWVTGASALRDVGRAAVHAGDAHVLADELPELFVSRGRLAPPLIEATLSPQLSIAGHEPDASSGVADIDVLSEASAQRPEPVSIVVAAAATDPPPAENAGDVRAHDTGDTVDGEASGGHPSGEVTCEPESADAPVVHETVDEEIDLTQLLEELRQWDTVLPDAPVRIDAPARTDLHGHVAPPPGSPPADTPPPTMEAPPPDNRPAPTPSSVEPAVAVASASAPGDPAAPVASDPATWGTLELPSAAEATPSSQTATDLEPRPEPEPPPLDPPVSSPGEGTVDLDAVFADLQRQTDTRVLAEQQLAAGRVFLAAGLAAEAARAFERASLEPRSRFAASQALAELHRSRGQVLEAVSWYEQASMAPVPDAAPKRAVLYDLAESLEALGETDRALGVLLDLLSQVEDYRDARARLDRLLRVDAGG